MVGGRGDRDEAIDLRAAHQQLQADVGAEAGARDPALARRFIELFEVVEHVGGIRQLGDAGIERALAAADTAEVEAHGGKAVGRKHLEQGDRHRVLHRAARFRVGVEDKGDGRVVARRLCVARLDPASGSGDDQFAHDVLATGCGVKFPRRERPRGATNTISASNFKLFV